MTSGRASGPCLPLNSLAAGGDRTALGAHMGA